MKSLINSNRLTSKPDGLVHRFVANIRGQTEVQYLNQGRKDQRHTLLHLPQPAEDCLCGPWSLLQAVLILRGWPRSPVLDQKGANATLRHFWQHVHNCCSEGTTDLQMKQLVDTLAPAISCDVTASRSVNRIATLASTAIDFGQVPLVRLSSPSWSHWTTVVGCEFLSTEVQPTALLLLDTNAEAPHLSVFNARLELQGASKARPGPHLRYLNGGTWRVSLDSIVVVKPGNTTVSGRRV